MAARKAQKSTPEVLVPEPSSIEHWLVLGIDPSLSRTGVAMLHVSGEATQWGFVGSVAPTDPSVFMWKRSKVIAKSVIQLLNEEISQSAVKPQGLLICVEMAFPTGNGINLIALNRVLMSQLLIPGLIKVFTEVRILSVLPQTLRSLMGLPRDSKDKKANVQRAYEFLPEGDFPFLDSDACDAVMTACLGRYAAYILAGLPDRLPAKILTTLCSAEPQARSAAGKIKKTQGMAGLMHWPDYWTTYEPQGITVNVKSSKNRRGDKHVVQV